MTDMVAGISKAAVAREAAMMEASSNFIWARKLRALRAALDKAEAERDRLLALLAEADRRIVWEALGFGSDFADQVQAALKGETP